MYEIIDNENKVKNYLKIENKSGKIWLLDMSNLKYSLAIYQPLSLKGKILKKIIYIDFLKVIGQKVNLKISNDLKKEIDILLKNKKYMISFFLGTPGIHQKVVFQINDNKKIYAYGKYTENNEIKKLFRNEYNILLLLNKLGIKNIPSILLYKKLNNNLEIIVQSTEKKYNFKSAGKLSRNHMNFQKKVYNITKNTIFFEDSKFYKNLMNFHKNLDNLNFYDFNIIKENIQYIISYFTNKKVDFGVAHRDFTNWNMIFKKNDIYVFDWEYASEEYPPFIDLFHYIIQSLKFSNQCDTKKIYNECKNKLYNFINNECEYSFQIIFKCYLVDILQIYILRDKNVKYEDLKLWIELLKIQ